MKHFRYYFAILSALYRRINWITRGLTLKKIINILKLFVSYILPVEFKNTYPLALKIDINSNCNLSCTTCVHANPASLDILSRQDFSNPHMSFESYKLIIDEISPYSTSVSLYYLGDPIVSPNLLEFASYAFKSGLSVHVSTNFSRRLSDDYIIGLATSGITHFTVCLDGFTQEEYSKTRVGGDIELVKDNLTKLCLAKSRHNCSSLKIEVQSLVFNHNKYQQHLISEFCNRIGVDTLTYLNGQLSNYTDYNFDNLILHNIKPTSFLPKCWWPFLSTVILNDGEVIPCCQHRMGEVYTQSRPDTLGNAFNSSIGSVWNSSSYRLLRKSMRNPSVYKKGFSSHSNFCAKCGFVCDTNVSSISQSFKSKDYDQIYIPSTSSRRFPVRR